MNLRNYIVCCAIDVTEGRNFHEMKTEIAEKFSIPPFKAGALLDMELQLIEMDMYVEGDIETKKLHGSYSQAIYA